MKIKFLIFLIFNFCLSAIAQNHDNSNYYKLFKDGKNIPRPIIYLFNKCSNVIEKQNDGDIVFNLKGESFKYLSKKHKKDKLTTSQFENIEFNKVKELSNLEYEEYSKRALEVKKMEGFKPAPPIGHTILKIYIISKIDNKFIRYETDWVYSDF